MKNMMISTRAAAAIRGAGLAVALMLGLGWTPMASAQKAFATPEAAMDAFGDALARSDSDAMQAVFGSDYRRYIPPVGDDYRLRFLSAWARSHAVKPMGEGKAQIAVGGEGWTFPIPIVRTAQGWQFDVRAGADEMRIRRIGRNELSVMQTMLAIYDAQMEYALADANTRRGSTVRPASATACTGRPRRASRRVRSGRRLRPPARPAVPAATATTAIATGCSPRKGRTLPAAPTTTQCAARRSAALPPLPGRCATATPAS